ncbi:MAG: type II toxin-antitoxin system RelE/ParE family toxin [Gammaproteobacteria bacterium]|nr:type II toxin-antitoxin system RelE/ParE family toxin [Gammaproteobacteria bacterium]
MQIHLVEKSKLTRPLYDFFDSVSERLCTKIFNKLQSYVEHGNVYKCNSLKTLNSRIWKYKGTIYKLRVDNDKESARVLFSKSNDGDLIIIHAFIKSTRKTPKKEAYQAVGIYQTLESIDKVLWETCINMGKR